MACLLTTGFDYECDDSVGGIKQGSLLITRFINITAYTNTAGEITAMTQAGGTSFFCYKIKKELVDFVSTGNHDPLLGTNFYEGVITAAMFKLSKEKNVELKLLAANALVVIVQDNNDIYHIFGLETGAEMTGTNTAASGKLLGDMNGYMLGFTDKGKNRFTVSTGLMATILIDGVNS